MTARVRCFRVALMVKAVFPGSFDPPPTATSTSSSGARGIFEELYVVVAVNRQKSYLFSPDERMSLLKDLLKGLSERLRPPLRHPDRGFRPEARLPGPPPRRAQRARTSPTNSSCPS
ncbi:MAG: hypothetical protein MZU97_07985 [Bacillus subtilis]|nr:hypothetical protein [Bacillus subtilis]